MQRLLLFLIVVALIVAGLGYNRGWFLVTTDPDTGRTKFSVDKEKWRTDREQATAYLVAKKNALTKKVEGAKDDEKAALQKDIDNLNAEIAKLEQHSMELDAADEAKLGSIQQKLNDLLDKIRREQVEKR